MNDTIKRLRRMMDKTQGMFYFFDVRNRRACYEKNSDVDITIRDSICGFDGYIVQEWPQDKIVAAVYGENVE